MNKAQLIAKISQQADLTLTDAKAALEAFMSIVKKAIKNKDNVALTGFGTFDSFHVKARTYTQPQTLARLKRPAYRKMRFKPAKAIKKMDI